jgi:hypothetical protein
MCACHSRARLRCCPAPPRPPPPRGFPAPLACYLDGHVRHGLPLGQRGGAALRRPAAAPAAAAVVGAGAIAPGKVRGLQAMRRRGKLMGWVGASGAAGAQPCGTTRGRLWCCELPAAPRPGLRTSAARVPPGAAGCLWRQDKSGAMHPAAPCSPAHSVSARHRVPAGPALEGARARTRGRGCVRGGAVAAARGRECFRIRGINKSEQQWRRQRRRQGRCCWHVERKAARARRRRPGASWVWAWLPALAERAPRRVPHTAVDLGAERQQLAARAADEQRRGVRPQVKRHGSAGTPLCVRRR